MKLKPIAVAFSDVHLSSWSKFNKNNSRTLNHFKVLAYVKKKCIALNVPALCMGDLFHKSESIDSKLLEITVDEFKRLDSEPYWSCFFIEGNHELVEQNKVISLGDSKLSKPLEYSSPGLVKSLSRVFGWLKPLYNGQQLYGGYTLWGVPYLDHNKDLNKHLLEMIERFKEFPHNKNILMLHTDYPGAKDTDDSEVGTVENLNTNLINKFDLVLIGHIHKPQRLSKKVYMVGAPLQQRRTDRNCDMGYWIIYNDLSMKFKSLSRKFPKFIDVEDEADIKDDFNYYTVLPKKNLVTVATKSNAITTNLSKDKLARKYLKAKGINDKGKAKLLKKLLKEGSND